MSGTLKIYGCVNCRDVEKADDHLPTERCIICGGNEWVYLREPNKRRDPEILIHDLCEALEKLLNGTVRYDEEPDSLVARASLDEGIALARSAISRAKGETT